MTEMETKMGNDCFRDQTGVPPQVLDLWEPIVIPREEIDEEIERLASLPQPANGRRRSLFVHPRNKKSQGLAPGIEVALDVLKPGERTIPYRQNSTQVNFVIRGEGIYQVNGNTRSAGLYDVWNTPSMAPYWHQNTGSDLYVRLTYSNAALLEMMNVHYTEENPPPRVAPVHEQLSAEDSKSPHESVWLLSPEQ